MRARSSLVELRAARAGYGRAMPAAARSVTGRTLVVGLLGIGLAVAVTASGCAPGTDRPSTSRDPSTGASTAEPSAGASSPGTPDAEPDLAAAALRDGVPITSQGVTVLVLAPSTPRALEDGSVRVDLAAAPTGGPTAALAAVPTAVPTAAHSNAAERDTTDGAGTSLVVAAPAPLRLDVLPDGTALVLDGDVPVAGLRADPSGRLETHGDAAVLTARAQPTGLWFTARAILDLAWGEREGGRSLAVTPADWTRAGGHAAEELAAAQLEAADAEAGSASMLAQLACHQLGARSKATWNLEPWRPDVDPFEMIATRCNPT